MVFAVCFAADWRAEGSDWSELGPLFSLLPILQPRSPQLRQPVVLFLSIALVVFLSIIFSFLKHQYSSFECLPEILLSLLVVFRPCFLSRSFMSTNVQHPQMRRQNIRTPSAVLDADGLRPQVSDISVAGL